MADHNGVHPGRVDHFLDRTVALGYTRIGYAVRSRQWHDDPRPGGLAGKHVLITGATSGIGLAAASGVGRLGAVVHVHGHDADHLREALKQLRREVPGAEFVAESCDIADLADVRRFGQDFAGRVPVLHALVHNAGTMAHERTETSEGHEQTVATHVLGPFLLTALLRDSVAADGDARVIFQSSGGMYDAPLRADDPEFRDGKYGGAKAYARTKRMQVVLAQQLAERFADAGVAVHSTHPGWVDTKGVREHLPKFRMITRPVIRPTDQGADTLVWLIAGPNRLEHTGGFWHDRRLRPTKHVREPNDTAEQRDQLWTYCATATGASFG